MRRPWFRLISAALVAALVATACGGDPVETGDGNQSSSTRPPTSDSDGEDPASSQIVQVVDRTTPSGDGTIAGQAITSFAVDLFGAARAETPGENLTLSPTSIAVALAMVEPGAVGDAQAQLRELLHIDDASAFHASMNALEAALEARGPGEYGEDSDPGELTLRIANASYLQKGYPFESTYLEAIGSNYGPVLNEVDFMSDPDAVAHEINAWVAEQTEDRITDLIADGVIDPATVLALVNALYMNASWLEPFAEAETVESPFTLLDGSTIEVPLMRGWSDSSSRGDGWVGATKQYTGGLYIQFILPDEGRFDEIADDVARVIDEYPMNSSGGAALHVPKFETRSSVELSPPLQALGLTAPYQEGNLLGIANDPKLVVDKVIHEAFLAIDEQGTEAAAATVVLMSTTSAPANEPVQVVLDRPFLYRIMDRETGTTLFTGQILDPTA